MGRRTSFPTLARSSPAPPRTPQPRARNPPPRCKLFGGRCPTVTGCVVVGLWHAFGQLPPAIYIVWLAFTGGLAGVRSNGPKGPPQLLPMTQKKKKGPGSANRTIFGGSLCNHEIRKLQIKFLQVETLMFSQTFVFIDISQTTHKAKGVSNDSHNTKHSWVTCLASMLQQTTSQENRHRHIYMLFPQTVTSPCHKALMHKNMGLHPHLHSGYTQIAWLQSQKQLVAHIQVQIIGCGYFTVTYIPIHMYKLTTTINKCLKPSNYKGLKPIGAYLSTILLMNWRSTTGEATPIRQYKRRTDMANNIKTKNSTNIQMPKTH